MVHCIKSEWNELRNAEISMSIFGNSEWTHWKLEQCGAIARHKWKICPLQLLTVRPSAQVHISARHDASELWWMKLVGTMHLKVVNMILFTAVRHHWFLLFLLGLFWFLLDETVWFLGGTEFFFKSLALWWRHMKTLVVSDVNICEHLAALISRLAISTWSTKNCRMLDDVPKSKHRRCSHWFTVR